MGVKGLISKFFKSRVQQSLRSETRTVKQDYRGAIVDHLELYLNVLTLDIDANFIFYAAANYAYALSEEYSSDVDYMRFLNRMNPAKRDIRCFELIEELLIFVIREIKPRHTVTINVDGPVPMTKISQQRPRRYVSSLDFNTNSLFNTASITPGTNWMMKLDAFFKDAIKRIYKIMLTEGLGVHLVYSSHLVPGEGEHKLFDRMKKTRDRYAKEGDGARIIFGGDTDLILLAMISRIDDIIIVTDTNYVVKGYDGVNIKFTAHDNTSPGVVHINILRKGIITELNRKATAVDDFVFIISLVGNDFIPRLPSMNAMIEGINAMMDTIRLKNVNIIDIDTKAVNWYNVAELLLTITYGNVDKSIPSQLDRIVIYNKDIGPNRAQWRPYQTALADTSDRKFIDKFRDAWYVNALGPVNPKYVGMKQIDVSHKEIIEMCCHYLYGMNWISKYYIHGTDYITWKWFYPYDYPPMMDDVLKVLNTLLEIEGGLEVLNPSRQDGEVRITPLHQMIAVMPPVAVNQLPTQLQNLFTDESLISSYLPIGFPIDQDGYTPHKDNTYYNGKYTRDTKRKDSWQGTPIIIQMDYDTIMEAIEVLEIEENIKNVYQFGKDVSLGVYSAAPNIYTRPRDINRLNDPVRRTDGYIPRGRGIGNNRREFYTNTRPAGPIDTPPLLQRTFVEEAFSSRDERGRGRDRRGNDRGRGERGRRGNDRGRGERGRGDAPPSIRDFKGGYTHTSL